MSFIGIQTIPNRKNFHRWHTNIAGGMAIVLALILASFVPPAGAQTATEQTIVANSPVALNGMMQASDGNFYASSFPLSNKCDSSADCGAIYKITPAGTVTTLYQFSDSSGFAPNPVIEGSDGNLYGTTELGGANGNGTIYKLTLSGDFTLLYALTATDGTGVGEGSDQAAQSLVQGSDGNFYGTTSSGGTNGGGTVFKITPTGTFSTLYSFGGSDLPDGIVQGSDGNFYGTTYSGGTNNDGAFFKLTSSGNFTLLYSFTEATTGGQGDLGQPTGPLVEADDGNFYGMTQYDTMFKVTSAGVLTPLYTTPIDNDLITEGLTLGSDGNFYAAITLGAPSVNGGCCGTIFQIQPSGTFATVYTFTGGADGSYPAGLLVQGSDGKLYGTTTGPFDSAVEGGSQPNAAGTVDSFALSPALPAPVQLSFSSGKDTVDVDSPVTLTWKVLNAFSTTMQQCAAFIQGGAAGAGTWTGLQTGTLTNSVYSGSATITPTADGTYTYALTCGGQESGFATLTVGNGLAVTTTTLSSATVGTAYSATLAATGGTAPYTWSVLSGSLPEGLALDASSGTISGTPTTAGTSTFTIQVADSESIPATATGSFSLTIAAAVPPSFSTTAANNGNITIASGAGGTMTLTTMASGGYTGTVNYSCSPSSATFTCSVAPTSVTFIAGGATTQTATLTINAFVTTSSDLKMPAKPFQGSSSIPIYSAMALWLPGSFLAFFGLRRKERGKHMRKILMLVLLCAGLASAAGLMGCGTIQKDITCAESGGSNCSNNTNTPAGSYTVTVISSDGTTKSTSTVNVTVQ